MVNVTFVTRLNNLYNHRGFLLYFVAPSSTRANLCDKERGGEREKKRESSMEKKQKLQKFLSSLYN